MTSQPRITVIVPARNAMTTLPACVGALRGSSCKPDQIIIFDDGLNSNISDIAKNDTVSVVRNGGVRVGPASARNFAARQANTDILAFVDADVVVEKQALARLVAVLESEPEIAAAFGCYNPAPRSRRLAGLYANLRHHWIHQHGDPEAATFWTGLGVVRADAFWALDGFDERSRIEDVDFGMRLRATGRRIKLVPNAQGAHLKDWRLLELWMTDISSRAYPWSLLIAQGARSNQLNTSLKERFAALLAYGFLISVLACFATYWFAIPAAIFAGLSIYCNRGLFHLIARRGGIRAMLAGIALHWLYYLYASTTFAVVYAVTKMRAVLSRVRRITFKRAAATVAIDRIPREEPPRS